MKINVIENFFSHYLTAFKRYNLNKVVACYHVPCTLNTPDKVVLLNDKKTCQQEFNDILFQLKNAKTSDIKVGEASYSLVTENLIVACVDWFFIDEQGEIFTDFCAIYHLAMVEGELKIINVISHELSNSIMLAQIFTIKEIKNES